MALMPLDNNANPIPIVSPRSAIDVTDGLYDNPPFTESGVFEDRMVLRLTGADSSAYSIDPDASTGTVSLPGNAVEFVAVNKGDKLAVSGTLNIAICY